METNYVEQFNDQEHKVIYDKRLALITGSANAAILLKQIIYWYTIKKGEVFYKFIEPCDHKACHDGDSRCEELGLSRDEFDNAIKLIGFKRGINKNFLNEEQAVVVYYTDSNRLTHYEFKPKVFNNLIKAYYLVNGKSPITKKMDIPKLLLEYNKLPTENTHMENDEKIVHTEIDILQSPEPVKKTRKTKVKKEPVYPELPEVIEYFKQNGYSELGATEAFNHYVAGDWHDGYGNKVIIRKQKMRTNWFKPKYSMNKHPLTKKEKIEFWETKVRTLTPESPERLAFVKEHRALWGDDVRDDIRETYNRRND